MATVFTLEGTKSKAKKTPKVGECKTFRNPRTKKTQKTCYVGKSKSSPTGWRIQKG